jgi:nicotinamidase-related amidase
MKGIFLLDDAAMPLVDHQVGTITLALSTPHDEIVRNTRARARTAREGGMPLVLTSSQEDHFQGLQLPDLQALVPDDNARRVKRPGVAAAWQYTPFCEAVERTGRTKLIMSGLTNDVCIVYPAISALEDGFAVQVVVDAGGSPTTLADETALRRMERAGVVLTSTNQVMAELATDWAGPVGSTVQRVMYEEVLKRLVEMD